MAGRDGSRTRPDPHPTGAGPGALRRALAAPRPTAGLGGDAMASHPAADVSRNPWQVPILRRDVLDARPWRVATTVSHSVRHAVETDLPGSPRPPSCSPGNGTRSCRPGGGFGCLLMILFSVLASIVLTVLVNLLL
ncbi:hypothetical protein [Micromonospora sp. NBC_00421]|uniref:hypothetical protein n=1 Tax=Micromonospora sp. NBC_00421 TaxID=2975976 RepID=UPI002E1DE4BD